uniref:Secreted protein n=1 Tax=Panagrellus redivivus TaxID=6233 RepID=A0A7E4VYB0_PANRE
MLDGTSIHDSFAIFNLTIHRVQPRPDPDPTSTMSFGTLLVLAVFGQVSTELVLEKDIAETVTFDGGELVIEVDR